MRVGKLTYYSDYVDNRDIGIRRSGRTTRIVDQLVGEFLSNGIADCFDHYPSEDMYKYVTEKVYYRLKFEHNITTDDIKVDRDRNILVNLLIPSAMEEYKKLITKKNY